ncbi:MAG TPA: SDR family NAD(P)-dependent oxidoreductase [Vicinamibacterales bacterium]|nr:SDR family NAD(P)-dependent oxidoreductase [Vicinamibacterales bacterium]
MNKPPLMGRTALVTGGGRGAGAVIASALAAVGAAVVLAARTKSEIDVVAERLSANGARVWAFDCDVSDPVSVEGLARSTAATAGRIDILVNNAGIGFAAPLAKTSLEDWQRVIGVNATGTFLCARTWLPGMLESGWGRIINIASVAGLSGDRYISAYAASKHAVVGFTRAMAAEVATHGVTVNAVCPTYLDTEMTQATLDRIVASTGRDRGSALDTIVAKSPQKRLVTPEEVAAAVVFLCGEHARGITGESLVIDGGELRR